MTKRYLVEVRPALKGEHVLDLDDDSTSRVAYAATDLSYLSAVVIEIVDAIGVAATNMTRALAGIAETLAAADPLDRPGMYDESDTRCFYCGMASRHGERDHPHHHSCPWIEARELCGLPLDGHMIYVPPEPKVMCEKCGMVRRYDDRDEYHFDGYDKHEIHMAAAEGLTVEEYRSKPINLFDLLPMFSVPRGAIPFIKPPATT